MEAKDKKAITAEILRKFAGTDPEMDIDWEMMEISFKAGKEELKREILEWAKDRVYVDLATLKEWGIE